jgi:hypothetical protein
MSDVLAVLRYVGTRDGGLPNPNGVDYDTVKGSAWNADTMPDKEGLLTFVGALPNPPWAPALGHQACRTSWWSCPR